MHSGSMVIAFNGEAKCGKTCVTAAVADVARSFILNDMVSRSPGSSTLTENTQCEVPLFDYVTTISAGNAYRAAALLVVLSARDNKPITAFNSDHHTELREILREPGMLDFLQTDPDIGRQVTSIASYSGAQALCSAIFSDAVVKAFTEHGEDKTALVVIDARDPVGHLQRNYRLGNLSGQVPPTRILPVYIETDVAIAAARDGKPDSLELITARRREDRTRKELPVYKPTLTIKDFDAWKAILMNSNNTHEVVPDYEFDNNPKGLERIHDFADRLVRVAGALSMQLAQFVG